MTTGSRCSQSLSSTTSCSPSSSRVSSSFPTRRALSGRHDDGLRETDSRSGHLKGSVDRIICDPPFLSEDCQTKGELMPNIFPACQVCGTANTRAAALTVRWLYKSQGEDRRLIVCTGERMETLIVKLYRSLGVKTVDYEPVHARGLSNEFYCYANFECDKWKWREAPGSAH